MNRRLSLGIFLLGILMSLPAMAQPGQLQYFGYAGNGDNDLGLNLTKGFTNFAHIATRDSTTDPFVRDRVTAIAQKGLKATIDLGRIFWCDYDQNNTFHYRCNDWQTRWQAWKTFNASILTPEKVLAFAVLDEPFNRGVNMAHYDEVVQKVKADFPWAKVWLFEGACVILDQCGYYQGLDLFDNYRGTLPGVDWVGVGTYGSLPSTNTTFLNARALVKSKFPNKGWIYVMDGYWDESVHGQEFVGIGDMKRVARDWYELAWQDSKAVLLGVFIWEEPAYPDWITSKDFPCSVLLEHVAIGREITRKTRLSTALPTGRFNGIDPYGNVRGWACDPDGTVCEQPRIDLYRDGSYFTQASYACTWAARYILMPQCGSSGVGYCFQKALSASTSGYAITAVARDLDSGSVTLPSDCAQNPACVWYTQLYDAKGFMEVISSTGYAAGWVCDPDAPQVSTKVRLTSDGTLIGTYTTNLANEQAVADECRGGYLHRFGVQLPSWTKGRSIRAYAQDLTGGEFQIPWLCPEGWSCSW